MKKRTQNFTSVELVIQIWIKLVHLHFTVVSGTSISTWKINLPTSSFWVLRPLVWLLTYKSFFVCCKMLRYFNFFSKFYYDSCSFLWLIHPGPFVWRLISTNPGLNFNPGLFVSVFKSLLLDRLLFYLWSIQSSNCS